MAVLANLVMGLTSLSLAWSKRYVFHALMVILLTTGMVVEIPQQS